MLCGYFKVKSLFLGKLKRILHTLVHSKMIFLPPVNIEFGLLELFGKSLP